MLPSVTTYSTLAMIAPPDWHFGESNTAGETRFRRRFFCPDRGIRRAGDGAALLDGIERPQATMLAAGEAIL